MAAFTSTQSGNWSDTATWGGSGPPGDGDTAIIATGHTVTVTGDVAVGSNASAVGDAVEIQATDGSTFGKLVVNDGVTLTLKGTDHTANTLMEIDRYALFEPQPGAIIVGDVGSDFDSSIRNKGRLEAIGTLAKPITFTVPTANRNWGSSIAGQSLTCAPWDKPNNIATALLGSPHLANAAGTGLGSLGDTSLVINSSSASLTTEVALGSYNDPAVNVDASGKYAVDYDMGVIYFYTSTFTGMSLNVDYDKLDLTAANWRGWGIVSDGAQTGNTCLLDHCEFNYLGAVGNGLLDGSARRSAPVNLEGHQTAAAGDSTRLAYVKNSTFAHGLRYVHIDGCMGTAGDPLLITGNDFNEQAGGTIWDGLSHYAGAACDYVKIDSNTMSTRGTFVDLANMSGDSDHLELSNNTGTCGIAFIAGGGTGGRTEYLAPNLAVAYGTTPNLHVHDNVIYGIGGTVDARFICVSGKSTGGAVFEDNEIYRCHRLGHLLGSYVTFRRNIFGYAYHHGFTGSQIDDIFVRDLAWENNLFLDDGASATAAIGLGYNHRTTMANVRIANNTCIGWTEGLVDFSDRSDNNGPSTTVNVSVVNNLISGGSYAFTNYSSATIPQTLHVVECDYNLCNGQATAYARNHDNTANATGFHRSGAKYNRETTTRNLDFVALFDASYTTNQTGRTLTHTVNTLGQDHTLTWGGGSPVQLIYDYGTSAGAGTRTVAVSGKTDWITNRNSVRTSYLWVVSGTGAGQVIPILWTSTAVAYAATVAAGGSGYTVGQYIRSTSGTVDTPAAHAVFEITSVSSGAVTGVRLVSGGGYTSAPTNPVSTTRITGVAGGSCTLNLSTAPGLLLAYDLTTDLDNTSVVAIVQGGVQLEDGSGGTVQAGLDLVNQSMGTTTQSDTGIEVSVDNTLYSAPSFVAAGAIPDYYQLQSGSPAIDAGTSDDAADADYWGTSRPAGSGDDLGFHEFSSGFQPAWAINSNQ